MPDIDEAPQEYQKGFNDGYLLAEHHPDLAQKLLAATGKSLQLDGIKEGIARYERERDKDKLPSWMRKDKDHSLEKDADKDKEDIDLDRE